MRSLTRAAAYRPGAAHRLVRKWARLPQALNTTTGPSPVWGADHFGARARQDLAALGP